jgi:very-short-patch-repair endonuclease
MSKYNFEDYAWSIDIKQRSWQAKDYKERFAIIREYYERKLPSLIDAISKGFVPSPYFLEWRWTPIEFNVWQDIRGLGLPFYPQIPVAGYFIDFGDPYHKIGIECDGKEWHKDVEREKVRDRKLNQAGWKIYHFTGRNTYVKAEDRYLFDFEEGKENYNQPNVKREDYEHSSELFLIELRKNLYWPEWNDIRRGNQYDNDEEEDFTPI